MQIEKLEYFLEVARTGSINQAAQNLHISAQALNQFVHLMERELDTKLFDGSRKGSKLTEQGEIVRTAAESVMQIWGQMKHELNAQQSVCDVVRIGCVPYYEWIY
jgi:molybdate transport repressor ModE-like protein